MRALKPKNLTMKKLDLEKLHESQDNRKKVRARRKDGRWSKVGYVEAGLKGVTQIQDGVRLGIYNEEGVKTDDEILIFDDIEEVELLE